MMRTKTELEKLRAIRQVIATMIDNRRMGMNIADETMDWNHGIAGINLTYGTERYLVTITRDPS